MKTEETKNAKQNKYETRRTHTSEHTMHKTNKIPQMARSLFTPISTLQKANENGEEEEKPYKISRKSF